MDGFVVILIPKCAVLKIPQRYYTIGYGINMLCKHLYDEIIL